MKVSETPLPGVKVIEMDRFEDERGWFSELWNEERYREVGLGDVRFVQTNISSSRQGVLRGMHFQSPDEQGKLVSVVAGSVFDVVIDIRRGSPDFGLWYGCELSAGNRRQLWVPEGFAHGFLALEGPAIIHYNCTSIYSATSDRCIAWNDPAVGIEWPGAPVEISSKDRNAPLLHQIPPEHLPTVTGGRTAQRAD
jgi:dTDP-4-dehydrorhamnose 3,5-epimerase